MNDKETQTTLTLNKTSLRVKLTNGNHLDVTEVAKAARQYIKINYPEFDTSVTVDRSTCSSSVRVFVKTKLIKKSTYIEMKQELNKLTAGHFDGLTDSYEHTKMLDDNGVRLVNGCYYMFVSRDTRFEFISEEEEEVEESGYPEMSKVNLDDNPVFGASNDFLLQAVSGNVDLNAMAREVLEHRFWSNDKIEEQAALIRKDQ